MIRKARTVSPDPRGGMARSVVYNVFGADDTVHVIELTGEGKVLSAGADLQWMKCNSEASVEWNLEDACRRHHAVARGHLPETDDCPGERRCARRRRRADLRLRHCGCQRVGVVRAERDEVLHPSGDHRLIRNQRHWQAPSRSGMRSVPAARG